MLSLFLIASSNDYTSGISFSPSELFVDSEGMCYEETYYSRESYRRGDEEDSIIPLEMHIASFYEMGYYNVGGDELEQRFNSLLLSLQQKD